MCGPFDFFLKRNSEAATDAATLYYRRCNGLGQYNEEKLVSLARDAIGLLSMQETDRIFVAGDRVSDIIRAGVLTEHYAWTTSTETQTAADDATAIGYPVLTSFDEQFRKVSDHLLEDFTIVNSEGNVTTVLFRMVVERDMRYVYRTDGDGRVATVSSESSSTPAGPYTISCKSTKRLYRWSTTAADSNAKTVTQDFNTNYEISGPENMESSLKIAVLAASFEYDQRKSGKQLDGAEVVKVRRSMRQKTKVDARGAGTLVPRFQASTAQKAMMLRHWCSADHIYGNSRTYEIDKSVVLANQLDALVCYTKNQKAPQPISMEWLLWSAFRGRALSREEDVLKETDIPLAEFQTPTTMVYLEAGVPGNVGHDATDRDLGHVISAICDVVITRRPAMIVNTGSAPFGDSFLIWPSWMEKSSGRIHHWAPLVLESKLWTGEAPLTEVDVIRKCRQMGYENVRWPNPAPAHGVCNRRSGVLSALLRWGMQQDPDKYKDIIQKRKDTIGDDNFLGGLFMELLIVIQRCATELFHDMAAENKVNNLVPPNGKQLFDRVMLELFSDHKATVERLRKSKQKLTKPPILVYCSPNRVLNEPVTATSRHAGIDEKVPILNVVSNEMTLPSVRSPTSSRTCENLTWQYHAGDRLRRCRSLHWHCFKDAGEHFIATVPIWNPDDEHKVEMYDGAKLVGPSRPVTAPPSTAPSPPTHSHVLTDLTYQATTSTRRQPGV